MPLLLSFRTQYFLLFFFITSYILIEYGLIILERQLKNNLELIDQEMLEAQEELKMSNMSARGKKVTNYVRKYEF
jgi:hypothetical protein